MLFSYCLVENGFIKFDILSGDYRRGKAALHLGPGLSPQLLRLWVLQAVFNAVGQILRLKRFGLIAIHFMIHNILGTGGVEADKRLVQLADQSIFKKPLYKDTYCCFFITDFNKETTG